VFSKKWNGVKLKVFSWVFRYNDLLTKEAQVSPKDGMCFVASPTANNIALADLSQQNAALRKQLSNSSQGDCNDLVVTTFLKI